MREVNSTGILTQFCEFPIPNSEELSINLHTQPFQKKVKSECRNCLGNSRSTMFSQFFVFITFENGILTQFSVFPISNSEELFIKLQTQRFEKIKSECRTCFVKFEIYSVFIVCIHYFRKF